MWNQNCGGGSCDCGECLPGQIPLVPMSKAGTFASMFTGGGLADIGARMAGLDHVWGFEIDPAIAEAAQLNGLHVIAHDVRELDFKHPYRANDRHESPFWLHMSPPCTNASSAKFEAGETPLDLELAGACSRAIEDLRPRRVSLENVYYYRTFESFRAICATLMRLGYQVRHWHLNAADFGVPQTRKRLIMVASLDGVPVKPSPTHMRYPERTGGLFDAIETMALPRWNGWLDAIADLIPTLPESKFADWQLKRLDEMKGTHLIGNQSDANGAADLRDANEPAVTVCAGDRNKLRAFVANCKDTNAYNANSPLHGQMVIIRDADEPMFTTVGSGPYPRAFIADSQNVNKHCLIREDTDPSFTVTNHLSTSKMPRAFIASGADSGNLRGRGELMMREADEPAATITAGHDRHPTRAWLETGRVVTMTPRCLARFQSVPDNYQLPAKAGLVVRIIGNGVPSLLMQRIIEANR